MCHALAPAHNLTVASNYGPTSYRPSEGNSGTSWAAPLVARVAAGYLEADPALSDTDIRAMLLAASRPDLETNTLNPMYEPYGYNTWVATSNTPNLLLRAGNVVITSHPQNRPAGSGSTSLTVTATPTPGLTTNGSA